MTDLVEGDLVSVYGSTVATEGFGEEVRKILWRSVGGRGEELVVDRGRVSHRSHESYVRDIDDFILF